MRSCVFSLLLVLYSVATASVTLNPLFCSNMVLQRNTEAPIWGRAQPGEKVLIEAGWGASSSAVAGDDGRWKATLKTGEAGGPYEVLIQGENSVRLSNVMLGEVWICSGQSNMEWPLGPIEAFSPPIRNSAEELAAAADPKLRLFKVGLNFSDTVQETCSGTWMPCTPVSAREFSATAYFFGRELRRKLDVPVGLIMTAVGGTEVEQWTRRDGLRRMPDFADAIERYDVAAEQIHFAQALKRMELKEDVNRGWELDSAEGDGWEPISSLSDYETSGLEAFDGSVWYRGSFTLDASQAAKSANLTLGAIDDNDDTWINGQHVGSTQQWNLARNYSVPRAVLREGVNSVVVRTVDTGGLGGFRDPSAVTMQVGDAPVPITGWKRRIGVDFGLGSQPAYRPSSQLYNGMIAPLIPFAIRGAIWYQGEANVDRAYQYRTSFPNMIRNWREDWRQGDFPFYFVQIAPFAYGMNDAAAELREAQYLAATLAPNSGMAVTCDIVPDVSNIHPPYKQEVGDRLARLALNRTYGRKDVVCDGPRFIAARVDGPRIIASFENANGLHFKGDRIAGLEVAGDDRVFHPADGFIFGGTLIASSPEVPAPVAIRLGWRDALVTNLFNGAGLPAAPFRSDDWPGVTVGVKW